VRLCVADTGRIGPVRGGGIKVVDNLEQILALHKKWVDGAEGGARANLSGADLQGAKLQGANLRWADLRWADLQWANLRGANLSGADLQGANLREANLQWANLRGANLSGADLQGAKLDFSDWPLWCGSLDARVDRGIAAQLAYHFCRLGCDDPEYLAARDAILKFANTFHRAEECGILTRREETE
jgi:hypothetical protein